MTRIPIRFDTVWRWFLAALCIPVSQSYLEVDGPQVHVRMGWSFRATFPRDAVASVQPLGSPVLSIGVHGMCGRWLVNGSHRGIAVLRLAPEQRARVLGFPVHLRELMLSVDDPEALRQALLES